MLQLVEIVMVILGLCNTLPPLPVYISVLVCEGLRMLIEIIQKVIE